MTSDEPHAPENEESDLRAATRAFQRARSSGVSSSRTSSSRASKNRWKPPGTRAGKASDPTLMSTALTEFLNHQGWEDDAARAGLSEHWREIVGEDVAEHVHVESWNDGQLVLRADSTAWATQVRLLTASLLERVSAALGPDVVESVQVKGPQAPSWRAGPRVVKGRGPRDTYG